MGGELKTIDLTFAQRKIISGLLQRFIPETEVWAYGSRVKWSARPNSDLDMVALATPEQKYAVSDLKESFEESDLSFRVDMFIWDEIPEQFHKNIKAEHVVLQGATDKAVMLDGWRESTLGKYSPFIYGKDISAGSRCENGSVKIYGSGGLIGFHNEAYVKEPGIIIGRIGTIGSVIYSSDPFWPIGSTFYITDGVGRDLKFTYYLLQTLRLDQMNAGSAVPRLNKDNAHRIKLNVPPLSEQKAIAHILGSLDDKIELNRRMNVTLEEMAQALFKSWFVDFDPVLDNALVAGNSIPDEFAERAKSRHQALACPRANPHRQANRETAKLFPEAFQHTEELGWIPKGWEVSTIVARAHLTMGQSPPSDHYNKEGNGLPFHQGVTNYGKRFPKHEQYSTGGNRYAEKGDILFSVRAPVGRINISDCSIIIGRGLSALRHKKNYQSFLLYFLKHVFQKEDSIGSGTIFNSVNKKQLENLPYIAPTDDLAKTFNHIANSLDEKITSNATQTQTLANIRDTLLPKLISGKLRIPDVKKLTEKALV